MSVYTDETCKDALWQIESVSSFDIWCGSEDVVNGKYVFSYISDSSCYYYTGCGLGNAPKYANKIVSENAVSVAVYSGGVMVLNESKELLFFGKGVSENEIFRGDIIAKNVFMMCGDFDKLAIIKESGELTVVGELPDSSSVSISDLISDNEDRE